MKQLKKPRMLHWRATVATLLAISVMVGASAQPGCYLNIYGASSVYVNSFPIEEVSKVTFSTDALTVHLTPSQGEATIPYDQLLKITFGEEAFVGIQATEVRGFSISYESAAHTVSIESNNHIDCVQLYNMQGQLMFTATPQQQQVVVDISNFASGVYIVRAFSGNMTETKKIIR